MFTHIRSWFRSVALPTPAAVLPIAGVMWLSLGAAMFHGCLRSDSPSAPSSELSDGSQSVVDLYKIGQPGGGGGGGGSPGTWGGPGDTVPPGGSGGPIGEGTLWPLGGVFCPACPTSFTTPLGGSCNRSLSPTFAGMFFPWGSPIVQTYAAFEFRFTLADYMALRTQATDADGNYTICATFGPPSQEIYYWESDRLNGRWTPAGPGPCRVGLEAVPARLVVDHPPQGIHQVPVFSGTPTGPFSLVVHRYGSAPNNCKQPVKGWITVNRQCMEDAIAYWDSVHFTIPSTEILLAIAFLTCATDI